MVKKLNKTVSFVKIINQPDVSNSIPYHVKKFGESETVVVIDKKAVLFENEFLFQDAECYDQDKKLKLKQLKNKY